MCKTCCCKIFVTVSVSHKPKFHLTTSIATQVLKCSTRAVITILLFLIRDTCIQIFSILLSTTVIADPAGLTRQYRCCRLKVHNVCYIFTFVKSIYYIQLFYQFIHFNKSREVKCLIKKKNFVDTQLTSHRGRRFTLV